MKNRLKFGFLSILTIFISCFNLYPELAHLSAYATRSTVASIEEYQVITLKNSDHLSEQQVYLKNTLNSLASSSSKSTNQAQIKYQSTPITTKTTSATPSFKQHFDYTNHHYANLGVGSNITLREMGNNIGEYRYCKYCKPFLYAHNRTNLFQNLARLKHGDTFSVRVNNQIKTYRVITNFTLNLRLLNPPTDTPVASNLRASLYKSTYGGKYDITLQTCAGPNDSLRRYIQAIELK